MSRVNSDDEIAVIVNSCDGAMRLVATDCDRTMFTQSIVILSKSSMSENRINLANPGDSLSMMSSNGEDNVETISQVLSTCFTEKY